MQISRRLWFGPAAALLFFAGIFVIALMTPGYSQVRQTVSELGEVGSPWQAVFSALLCLVALCLIIFASGVARTMRACGHATLPAWLVAALAISSAGVGLFSFPHPLHNVFGMSELIGYQAPLAAAMVCRGDRRARRLVVFSGVMYVAVLLAIAANLVTLDRHGELWHQVQPFYGIVQRLLFGTWFVWCAGYGWLLMRQLK